MAAIRTAAPAAMASAIFTATNAAMRRTPPRRIRTRVCRKAAGREAKLAYTGHLLMENRNGLVVDAG